MADADAAETADFDSLLQDVLANPDLLHDKTQVPDEVLLELQKRLNPYTPVAVAPTPEGTSRVAACSYTNLREDYLRRLTMTSLVGFLFQMLHEWEVPEKQRRWLAGSKKKEKAAAAAGGAPAVQPYDAGDLVRRVETVLAVDAGDLVRRVETVLAVAKEAQTAAAAAKEARLAALTEAALGARDGALEAAQLDCEARAAALLYAATAELHQAGAAALARLGATAEAASKYPSVKEVIDKFPQPAAPGTVEIPPTVAKGIIEGFLRHWFEFDPSIHVRSGHDEKKTAAAVEAIMVGLGPSAVDTADPRRLPLQALRANPPKPGRDDHAAALNYILEDRRSCDVVLRLLHDDDLADAALVALGSAQDFRHYLYPVTPGNPARKAADVVPPQDTYHRWAYFTEVNYDTLRVITETLYPEKPDLDWALAIWDVFEGPTSVVTEKFDKFCQRVQDTTPSSIKSLDIGKWSLLASFGANRRNMQIYNQHTEVLKRILDRHASEQKLGGDLMRKRVHKEKAKNIAEEGPDAPGLKTYRQNVVSRPNAAGMTANTAHSLGAEKVISETRMGFLEKAGGDLRIAGLLEELDAAERRLAASQAGRADAKAEAEQDALALQVADLRARLAALGHSGADAAASGDTASANAALADAARANAAMAAATANAAGALDGEARMRARAATGDIQAKQELEAIDEIRARLTELKTLAADRRAAGEGLTVEEQREVQDLIDRTATAKQMLEVPDDAIQVDMFVTSGGSTSKRSIYTAAEAPEHLRSGPTPGAPAARAAPVAGAAGAADLGPELAPDFGRKKPLADRATPEAAGPQSPR